MKTEFKWWPKSVETGGGWPEEVPIPGPGDFCAEQLYFGTRRCLMGWASGFPTDVVGEVVDALCKRVGTDFVAAWNDDHSPEARAEVWKETMADLGYTEDVHE